MKYIKENTFAELYTQVIKLVYENPEYETSPRGKPIKECLNVWLTLTNPTSNLFKCNNKSITMPTAYTKKEIMMYLAAINDADTFSSAASFWSSIKNSDNTINSAYGNLIFNPSLSDGRSQFDWAYDCLVADKDSRQAFMRYNNTIHQHAGVKDLPCTFIQSFHIRNNKLHSTVQMRSNDIVKGLIHDLPSFTLFQYLMFLKLKHTAYPELELGEYNHLANSLHVYECDFELCKQRLAEGLLENSYPLPNDYTVIKSHDITYLIDKKIKKSIKGLTNDDLQKLKLVSNIDFYNWLMS